MAQQPNTRPGRREAVLYVRGIPLDVKAQFKAYCARNGYTMQQAIETLMRNCIRDDRPLPNTKRGNAGNGSTQ